MWYLSPSSEKQEQSHAYKQEHKRSRPDKPATFTAIAADDNAAC